MPIWRGNRLAAHLFLRDSVTDITKHELSGEDGHCLGSSALTIKAGRLDQTRLAILKNLNPVNQFTP